MTADSVIRNRMKRVNATYIADLTMNDIEDMMQEYAREYASQQREEGIREGFEAAREIDPLSKLQHFLVYPTADDYLNSK